MQLIEGDGERLESLNVLKLASKILRNLHIIWDTMPTGYLVGSLAAFFALSVYLESARDQSISTPSMNGVIRQHRRLHHLAPQFTPTA